MLDHLQTSIDVRFTHAFAGFSFRAQSVFAFDGFTSVRRTDSFRLTFINRAPESMLDRSAGVLLGDTIWDQFPALDIDVEQLPRRASDAGESIRHGYWEQLELYLRNHSEADFTLGMCPDCAGTHSLSRLTRSSTDTYRDI